MGNFRLTPPIFDSNAFLITCGYWKNNIYQLRNHIYSMYITSPFRIEHARLTVYFHLCHLRKKKKNVTENSKEHRNFHITSIVFTPTSRYHPNGLGVGLKCVFECKKSNRLKTSRGFFLTLRRCATHIQRSRRATLSDQKHRYNVIYEVKVRHRVHFMGVGCLYILYCISYTTDIVSVYYYI